MTDYTFSELVDLEQVRQLLEAHNRLSKMAYGVFDPHENNLIAVGWQEICTRFHRTNPVTCAYCHESDAYIKAHLHNFNGKPLEYRCKNNMIDIAMPILLEGRHLATFFTGQFFYDDSPPDRDYFIQQGKALGFDIEAYLQALDRVPMLSREHIQGNVVFLHHMVQVLAESGMRTLRLTREMAERKRAGEALRQSETEFRAIFDQTFQFIGVLAVDGTLLRVNQSALQFAGVQADAVIGKPFWEAPWWTHSAEMQQRLRAAIQEAGGGKLVRFETTHVARNGEVHCIDFSLKPVTDAAGRVVELIPEGRDITERKRAEDALRKLNDELDRRVKERTVEMQVKSGELQESQRALMNLVEDLNEKAAALELSNHELAAVNHELEAFSYSVSHDLRAPLRSVDGFSRLLLEQFNDKLDDKGRDYLQRVCAASLRMGHLIDDLLMLSRITRSEMHRQPVDLSALAAMVADNLQKTEPQRRVRWSIASRLTAQGDPRLLQIVLENLLGNAWKFTGKQPAPRIEFGVMERHGARAFFVRDNGAGFDMTYAGKLFGAFQRLHAAADFPGTGIGLATVQRIIRRHGGQIEAEGVTGRGATFYFTLP